MNNDLTIDPWSFLDYKSGFDPKGRTGLAPTWVADHKRRLSAYMCLESYYRNMSRKWLSGMSEEDQNARREYGDAMVIVETYLNSVLGESQTIQTVGLPGEEPTDEAKKYQQQLEEWSINEQFPAKMYECERNAIKLGDGVYVLGWNEDNKRANVEVWDPGFYFPVLDETDPSNFFPNKVHIAYQYEDTNSQGVTTQYVRRRTWEIVDTDDDRTYEWNSGPVRKTVLYTDGIWKLNDVTKIDDLTWPNGRFTEEQTDLQMDWIPVVHIPDFIALNEHYGRSVLSNILQTMDDIVSTDTDLQAASATTGTPPIVISGGRAEKNAEGKVTGYGPGSVIETNDGTATIIDTSNSLDALLKYDEHLLERLSVNGRVPESLLGRVKPNEVPSGIALTLSFTPHSQAVKEMRLVRDAKYTLLLKFVGRLMLRNRVVSKIFPARVHFGPFLPADRQETATLVQTLYTAKAISIETAIRMLREAGFPITEIAEEVKRIQENDFEGAAAMGDATGDLNAVRERLGLAAIALPTPGGVPPEPTGTPAPAGPPGGSAGGQ